MVLVLAATVSTPGAPGNPQNPTDKFKNLEFREIGPAVMGGRIDDFAVVESNPNIVYVGTASGGVWKTTNNGTTWEPVFDKEGVSTIGDIAIAPSDPSVVWVGSGEPNNRQSSSWGDGIYKSLDGGEFALAEEFSDLLDGGEGEVGVGVGHLWLSVRDADGNLAQRTRRRG